MSLAGCSIHACKKFLELLNANKKNNAATKIVNLIATLYKMRTKWNFIIWRSEWLKIRQIEDRLIVDRIITFMESEIRCTLLNQLYAKA
ncbi:hypothetical protein EHQ43_15210 [Leptospira bouyouniensis]|uniref:Transposase IS66 central domain-containing protein n=1 Tax=Leptospira bouyouniensis TaxID=2484911 RepID=A0A7I0HPR5_9LEPT|nr:hypothetical protein EHQ43_15210 [Leptospira bouyouniensis]